MLEHTTEDTAAPDAAERKAAKFIPADEFMISDLDTLKVLADPLRLSILELLYKPGTVKSVAASIGRPPTKLYYHFNLLEKHGLLTMVDTRIVSGIVEKHYQASAKVYRLESNLLSPGDGNFNENIDLTLNAMFASAREDLHASLQANVTEIGKDVPPHRRAIVSQTRLNLTPDQAEEFYQRLETLVKDFQNTDDEDEHPDARNYKMLLLLHPSGHQLLQSDDAEAGE